MRPWHLLIPGSVALILPWPADVGRFMIPVVPFLLLMMVRGIDSGGNWVHVAPPTRNFAAADLRLHERIKQDQSTALADGATQALHKAY